MPYKKYTAVKKTKTIKLKMLHGKNMLNKTAAINNSSIWILQWKPFETKGITRVIFPDNLLVYVLTNNT